ncbi:phosphatase PAP2 family protein [Rhodanobacter sp. DHG33]|uniref:phosphatase PAP2 family protein n=1 Tax=Rhodanobacter sp. DHG33 TaxID=2775921 RepID=UPI001782A5BE|nr:phosphatase PAP2 family protein [Rhodanobacter sp. DHG33]MBD8900142.1 phosphatase PAP2 family protein [Rhodanobacter sp. DHG33]
MESLPFWIGQHVLMLWALVLILALLSGDLVWRMVHRRQLAAAHKSGRLALRPRTALVLMALFGTLFALLFRAVWKQTALVDFDAALAQSLHDRLPTGVLIVVAIVTHIGEPALLAVAGAVVAALLASRRNWRMCIPWCVALGGAIISGELAKHIVKRARPFDGHAFVVETGYSFPSGHSFMSMVFFGMLAWLLLRALLPRHHRIAVAVAVGLVTVVGISRVVLQAHYLSDVLAGYALGAFWLVLGIAMAESMRRDAGAR